MSIHATCIVRRKSRAALIWIGRGGYKTWCCMCLMNEGICLLGSNVMTVRLRQREKIGRWFLCSLCLCETSCWHAGSAYILYIWMKMRVYYYADCTAATGHVNPSFLNLLCLQLHCVLSGALDSASASSCLWALCWCHGANEAVRVGWQYLGWANGTHLF